MRKNIIRGLAVILALSVISNIYLLGRVESLAKMLNKNIGRISFMENNFDEAVKELILEETASKDDNLLEDVKFTLSELTDTKAKKAMIDVEFKLKRMDSTTRTFVSIECGQEEPQLMEILPINDTTYRIEREICILQPLRVDLVIEKYGEKKLINLVQEDEMFKSFAGETQFELEGFEYDYNKENGQLFTSFSTRVLYTPKEGNKLAEASLIVEKNGITILNLPLESSSEGQSGENILYSKDILDLELLGMDGDDITMALILQEKNNFIHRFEFVKCQFEKGEEMIRAEIAPIVTLK